MKNDEYLFKVIQTPHNSEKSVRLADNHRQYTFKVISEATKADVKQAVERLFDVKVVTVNSTKLKNIKKRNMRTGRVGTKRGYKKMYVTLAEGEQITFVTEGA